MKAFLILQGVEAEHLAHKLVACSHIEVKRPIRHIHAHIPGHLACFGIVIIEVIDFLIDVELVRTIVFVNEHRVGHIVKEHKTGGQCIVRLPAVLQLTRAVTTCAILAVNAGFDGWRERAYGQVALVVGAQRRYVLGQV